MQMRRNKAGSHTHIRSEHLHTWLREAYPAENSTTTPKPTQCLELVEPVQFMWESRSIHTELGWNVLVLIRKVNSGTWGVVFQYNVCTGNKNI